MSDNSKRSFGLMFHRKGNNSLIVEALERKDGERSPVNMDWWVGDKLPLLRGLTMRGHTYEMNGHAHFYTDRPCFYIQYGVHDIRLDEAKAMADMLGKIDKAFLRDNAYDDEGDKFLSLARAIGAKWICTPHTTDCRITESSDKTRWLWLGLTDGRNEYRRTIVGMKREVASAYEAEQKAKAAVST